MIVKKPRVLRLISEFTITICMFCVHEEERKEERIKTLRNTTSVSTGTSRSSNNDAYGETYEFMRDSHAQISPVKYHDSRDYIDM